MNTFSEIEEYYKAREQQLLKKLHQQEAALAAANQKLKQLTEDQKVSEDETARQRAAREQQLRDELYRDPLTGTYNRRYYEDIASRIVGPAGVALLDVDDFKICNDTYGHYAGDMALKTAAKAIQSCIRESDLLIRYGGDEFLLVLPGIPGDFLQTKLEQIRTACLLYTSASMIVFAVVFSITVVIAGWFLLREKQQRELRAEKETNLRLEQYNIQLTQANDEMRRAQDAAAEALQSAERASKAKTDFLSNMSHDIRTPMNLSLIHISCRSCPLPQKCRRAACPSRGTGWVRGASTPPGRPATAALRLLRFSG